VSVVEVGGKRNLPEFIRIASSFRIPVGVLYDQDSSDFHNRRNEESSYNTLLDRFEKADGTIRVWQIKKNYEAALEAALGAQKYAELCQKYPGSKPTRARLIALEPDLALPDPLPQLLKGAIPHTASVPQGTK